MLSSAILRGEIVSGQKGTLTMKERRLGLRLPSNMFYSATRVFFFLMLFCFAKAHADDYEEYVASYQLNLFGSYSPQLAASVLQMVHEETVYADAPQLAAGRIHLRAVGMTVQKACGAAS